jgi:hypothetical protein
MGLAFDGLLGGHLLFAVIWIATSFVGVAMLSRVVKAPANISALKNALMMRALVAASGGLTVLIGAGFYYYVEFYRTSYAISAKGLPLVDAGALIGVIAFIWQTAQGARIRRALKEQLASLRSTTTVSNAPTVQSSQLQTKLPSRAMLIIPPILLVVAFLLMGAGAMM